MLHGSGGKVPGEPNESRVTNRKPKSFMVSGAVAGGVLLGGLALFGVIGANEASAAATIAAASATVVGIVRPRPVRSGDGQNHVDAEA